MKLVKILMSILLISALCLPVVSATSIASTSDINTHKMTMEEKKKMIDQAANQTYITIDTPYGQFKTTNYSIEAVGKEQLIKKYIEFSQVQNRIKDKSAISNFKQNIEIVPSLSVTPLSSIAARYQERSTMTTASNIFNIGGTLQPNTNTLPGGMSQNSFLEREIYFNRNFDAVEVGCTLKSGGGYRCFVAVYDDGFSQTNPVTDSFNPIAFDMAGSANYDVSISGGVDYITIRDNSNGNTYTIAYNDATCHGNDASYRIANYKGSS